MSPHTTTTLINRHADALTQLGVKILGIVDVNPESAKRLADAYDTVVVSDLAQIAGDLDMVHICTPSAFHIPYAKIAMEAGCHVVMEKPMATNLEDAQALVELARIHGVQLMIDFNHRFRTGFQTLLEQVQSGRLGDIINVTFSRTGLLGGNAGSPLPVARLHARTAAPPRWLRSP